MYKVLLELIDKIKYVSASGLTLECALRASSPDFVLSNLARQKSLLRFSIKQMNSQKTKRSSKKKVTGLEPYPGVRVRVRIPSPNFKSHFLSVRVSVSVLEFGAI